MLFMASPYSVVGLALMEQAESLEPAAAVGRYVVSEDFPQDGGSASHRLRLDPPWRWPTVP